MSTRPSCLIHCLYMYGPSAVTFTIAAVSACAAISVTDDSGAIVTLQHPAQHIISLAPYMTELLLAAGDKVCITGAVAYSDYPPPVHDIPHINNSRSLDLERVAAFKPDLVVTWHHNNAQRQINRLHTLSVPLFFSRPHRMNDIPRSVEALGMLLDTRVSTHDATQ